MDSFDRPRATYNKVKKLAKRPPYSLASARTLWRTGTAQTFDRVLGWRHRETSATMAPSERRTVCIRASLSASLSSFSLLLC